ncbi:MAG TPA: hypothetical protein VHL79_21860 [Ramlibacter sp.]|nr:hypothetical protein [Ramlibacter sp.]
MRITFSPSLPARHAAGVALCLAATCGPVAAQGLFQDWQAGAVLDISAASRALALGQRDKGLALGHSDVSVFGPVGRHFEARATAAAHTDERKLEVELEEAWLQTTSLPAGLQLRAGRFASQVGYLNEQHLHADDFIQRPLLYRAFLGNHWFDDGLRLNWTAPTDLYLRVGAEVFRGKQLVRDAASARRPGAAVFSAKTGGDIGASQSWQAGLSFLRNRREAAIEAGHAGHAGEEEEHAEGEEAHEEETGAHAHGHGAAFSGRRMWVAELAWKWAPEGNNSRQQLRVAYEHALVRGINRFATSGDRHRAHYLSVVYRFAPGWEVGARHDLLRVRIPHEDHFDDGRLRESALMLAWKPSHAQTLRVQFTRQRNGAGFAEANRALQIQYVLSFGAHAAHSF